MPAPKKILLIYTGGTIGMRKNAEGVYAPFDFSHIQSEFPEINSLGCDLEVFSFDPPVDSSNIGPETWIAIANVIRDHYEEWDGFVILHGSDTMAYTGSALSFMLEDIDKPVILTGSQLPINEIRTDAKENLVSSIQIASDPQTRIREVGIYFEHKLFRANRTKKVAADVFYAFNSPNFPALVEAGVEIKYRHPTPKDAWSGSGFHIQSQLETRIGVLKFFPGMHLDLLKPLLEGPEIKGIIIESYGAGNLPTNPALVESLRKAIESGKYILNITQCTEGGIEMGRYETSKLLQKHGVLSGVDLTFEAALTKMMYVLGRYQQPEEIRHFLTHNIRGELTGERAWQS